MTIIRLNDSRIKEFTKTKLKKKPSYLYPGPLNKSEKTSYLWQVWLDLFFDKSQVKSSLKTQKRQVTCFLRKILFSLLIIFSPVFWPNSQNLKIWSIKRLRKNKNFFQKNKWLVFFESSNLTWLVTCKKTSHK